MVERGYHWTIEEYQRCWELGQAGLTVREIAEEIGRTKAAVKFKMSDKGLYYHPPVEGN